jgi:hypothetical protein
MKWVLLIGLVWLLLGVLICVPLGRTIRAANRTDEELRQLSEWALDLSYGPKWRRAGPHRLRLVRSSADDGERDRPHQDG